MKLGTDAHQRCSNNTFAVFFESATYMPDRGEVRELFRHIVYEEKFVVQLP
ncbi:hypothetical protein PGB90_004135 [Kerria lacca]